MAAIAGPVLVERLGYDLENTKLVLSLSAPLLEGWGGPQRVQRLWPAMQIIQAEAGALPHWHLRCAPVEPQAR